MQKLAIAMLATAAITLPSVCAMAQNSPAPQMQPPPQIQQPSQSPALQPQANDNANHQAQNQLISPNNLSRDEVRQVQTALNNNGDKVARVDGRWGPNTRDALRRFQQSKGIQASGQLDQQTVADLGLNTDQFIQAKKS